MSATRPGVARVPARRGTSQHGRGLLGTLAWGHVMVLLDKVDDASTRDWYANQADAHGWSRNVLLNQIMSRAA